MSLTDSEKLELKRLQDKAREDSESECCTIFTADGTRVKLPLHSPEAKKFLKENFDIDIDQESDRDPAKKDNKDE